DRQRREHFGPARRTRHGRLRRGQGRPHQRQQGAGDGMGAGGARQCRGHRTGREPRPDRALRRRRGCRAARRDPAAQADGSRRGCRVLPRLACLARGRLCPGRGARAAWRRRDSRGPGTGTRERMTTMRAKTDAVTLDPDLLATLYRGPIELEPWRDFLRALAVTAGCDNAAISLQLSRKGLASVTLWADPPEV